MSIDRRSHIISGWRLAAGYLLAVVTVSAVVFISLILRPIYADLNFRAPYILLIGLITYFFGRGPGTVAFLASVLGYTAISTPILWPQQTLLYSAGNRIEYSIFILTGLASLVAMVSLNNTKQRVAERTRQLEDQIIERKQAEEALRENEERLRVIFDNAGVGIVEVNTDEDSFIAVNDRVLEILGYTREELLNMTVHELTAPEDRSRSDEMNQRLHQGEFDRFSYQKRYLRRDGTPVWVSVNISAIHDAEGRFLRSIATIEDISELKEKEAALRESEERYRKLFSSMSEGFALGEAIFDESGVPVDIRFLEVNPAFEHLTGIATDVATSKTISEILPGIERHWIETYGSVVTTREPIRFINYNQDLDKWFEVFAYSPQAGRFAILFFNVTDRVNAEQILRESEERFRTLADNISQLAWMTDENGWIYWYNKRWYDYTGTTFEEMQGWGWQKVHHPDHVQRVTEKFKHNLETGETWEDTFPLRGRDGNYRWFLSRAVPIRSDDGRIYRWFGTNTDITELLEAQEEIRELNAGLEQRVAERTAELESANKELEAFSYSVSHDLRAPLRAIDGFSNTLLKNYRDSLDERGQDYLQRVRNAAQRMGRLIDDILGLSRATRAEMHVQRVDLTKMAEEIIQDLRRSQPERKAETEVQQGLEANADPHLIKIALDNLLGNAWKFAGNREVTRIEVGAFEQNGERVYYVKDNGAGFSSTYADKLFSPFQRLHSESEFPGTGIGLALVQRILRRHGGRIWAESEVDQGATFYFTLEGSD